MANTICRDIRVDDHLDIRLNPTDTLYRVFYGNDTSPTEVCYYNHIEHISYGYSPLDGDWFAVSHTDSGEFAGSSANCEYATTFPVDIRNQLLSL